MHSGRGDVPVRCLLRPLRLFNCQGPMTMFPLPKGSIHLQKFVCDSFVQLPYLAFDDGMAVLVMGSGNFVRIDALVGQALVQGD